jgi:hypothetical protein
MRIKRIAAAAALACAAFLAGCGGSQRAAHPTAFGWLHPAPPPANWDVAHLSGTAAIAYPGTWERIESDPGTVSAARVESGSGLITQYLNATPQQAEETLQNWVRFRLAHNANEGDGDEQMVAAGQGLRFRNGTGSCVIDRYRTSRARYEEIACLVRSRTEETVVVAAALTGQWARDSAALERSVSAFLA